MYIRCNNNLDDREYFNLPNAHVNRIKKYIAEHLPEIIPDDYYSDTLEFQEDFCSLQTLFADRDELLDFLIDAADNCASPADCNRLNAIIDYINPQDDDYLSDYTQKSPYVICSVVPFGEPQFNDFSVNDPSTAIFQWFKYCEKYPLCVSICAKNNDYAKKLLEWVLDNKDQVMECYNKFNVPYKLDYLLDESARKVNSSNIISWPGDQVYPFCAG